MRTRFERWILPSFRAGLQGVGIARWLLLAALLLNVGAALVAYATPVGPNDLLLHSRMVDSFLVAWREAGWTVFQDPWSTTFNGGYALARVYGHLGHQLTALFALITGLEAADALSWTYGGTVLLFPATTYIGGRIFGLSPKAAALAAFVVATMRSLEQRGHGPLEYGYVGGVGLAAQAWAMGMAALVLPLWVSASSSDGAGLRRLSPLARGALAAVCLSLLVRLHPPTTVVVVLIAPLVMAFAGSRAEVVQRTLRFSLVGAVALFLSLGYILPLVGDLGAVAACGLEDRADVVGVGAAQVLLGLLRGDFLDGGHPGPWGLLLLLVGGVTATTLVRGGRVPHGIAGLGAGMLLTLLLLFGRATWGGWVDSIPVLGRMHDGRYVLGIQLLAPWFLGLGLVDLASRASPAKVRLVAVPILFLAAGLQFAELQAQNRGLSEARPTLDAMREGMNSVATEARSEPFEPVTLSDPGPWPLGANPLLWMQRTGAPTAYFPGHHYSHVVEFSRFWHAWLEARDGLRKRPIEDADLRAMAVSRRLILPRDATGNPIGPWRLESLGPADDQRGDAVLVRSDLLFGPVGEHIDGFTIAWFLSGAHRGRQHPTIAVHGYGPEDAERYDRVASATQREMMMFDGLPTAGDGELGRITAVDGGEGPWDRLVQVEAAGDVAWLMLGIAWHPGWQVTINGDPEPTRMLAPGLLGVPLKPGQNEVAVRWVVPQWRGPWAALNTMLILGLLLWVGIRGRADLP